MFDMSCERNLLRTIFKPERSLDVSGQAQLAELQQKLGVAHLEALHISRIGGASSTYPNLDSKNQHKSIGIHTNP